MKKPTIIIARFDTVCYYCKGQCKGKEIKSEAGKWVHAFKCYDEFRDRNVKQQAIVVTCENLLKELDKKVQMSLF